MRICWVCGIALWLLLASAAWADDGAIAELSQVDPSRYPEVTLYVNVRDRAGAIIEGLTQEDFAVTEDGQPAPIIAFSAGVSSAIATVLTIDRSGSMSEEGKLEGARLAASAFVDLMRAQDTAALVVFDDTVHLLHDFTADRAALKERIASITIGDCTAWYDGVYASVDMISALSGRRSVILLSDGMDCRESWMLGAVGHGSEHTLEEAIAHAQEARIPVYTIGFGSQATDQVGDAGFDRAKLLRMATDTGGKFYHAPNADELRRLYQSLSIEMQKEYVITYRSPRPTYDGTRRAINVTVHPHGGPAVATGSKSYLERHLVNIRSNGWIALALLAPLSLALLAPPAVAAARRRTALREEKRVAQELSEPTVSETQAGREAPARREEPRESLEGTPPPTASCARCGSPIRAGARFCARCGQPVVALPERCPNCRREIRPGARFCANCGHKL